MEKDGGLHVEMEKWRSVDIDPRIDDLKIARSLIDKI